MRKIVKDQENLENFNNQLNKQFQLVQQKHKQRRRRKKPIKDVKKIVKKIFNTPGHSAAFSSPGNILRYFKRKGNKTVKRRDVESALRSEDAYTLYKEHKRINTRNPFFVYGKREQAQLDLCDVRSLAKANDKVTFLLTVIDIFTKKLFVRPLKQKTADATRDAIESILDEMELNGKLQKAFMDHGKEFKNGKVQKLFKSRKIHYFYSTGDLKASVVERVNGSLKQLIWKYLEGKDVSSLRYIDQLNHLVKTYNNRPHRSLKYMSPNDAELPINQNHVLNAHFQHYSNIFKKRTKPKFKIGDTIIVKNIKKPFQKGYNRRYNTELYKIHELDPKKKPIPMYALQSEEKNDIIDGRFYEKEFQLVDK